MRHLTLPALASLLLVTPALAQPAPPVIQTVLKLAETATVTIQPDELTASLLAETVAASAAETQARVNKSIADALTGRARTRPNAGRPVSRWN